MKSILRILLLFIMLSLSKLQGEIDEKVEVPQWSITQHSDAAGNVMLFYTIEDNDGNLVIIDGGFDTNADKVREIIAQHENHVAAWIITHPHPDHAMAFNAIMKEPGEITVDQIYTIKVNYDKYKETAQDYDRFDVYEEFLKVTKDLTNVTYVKENDVIDLLGLKMLFCADVENETEQIIIDRHRESLDVDYVQLGHHGNWGMTEKFYEYTSPKAVFFDVPEWLLNDQNHTYDAWKLRDYFKSKNVKIYVFGSEVNQIILR